ncbi:MAG TPA: hypothetical protein H9673_06815 [Candidatus Adamsella sp.]|nr:hypothetical protein [Candidatus Adamsella sp.]
MLGLSAIIKSFFDCISQFAKYGQAKIENQETTTIIEDKENLEKARNIAEQIIEIAQKYKSSMSKRDQRKLKSLIKKFNKVD